MMLSVAQQLSETFCSADQRIRLAPGYLHIPGLFGFATNLMQNTSDIPIDNVSYDLPLELMIRNDQHLEEAVRMVKVWSNPSRQRAHRVVASVAACFKRSFELMEQSEENRIAGLRLLQSLKAGRLRVRIYIHGPLPLRCAMTGESHDSITSAWVSTANLFFHRSCKKHISLHRWIRPLHAPFYAATLSDCGWRLFQQQSFSLKQSKSPGYVYYHHHMMST